MKRLGQNEHSMSPTQENKLKVRLEEVEWLIEDMKAQSKANKDIRFYRRLQDLYKQREEILEKAKLGEVWWYAEKVS